MDNKLISTEDSALFADSTYHMNGTNKRQAKYDKINKEVENTGYEVVPKFTNKGMVVFQNKNDNSKIHVAHKGTSLTAKSGFKDVIADFAIGAGLTSHNNTFNKRDRQTKKIVKHYEKLHGDNFKLSASGHSLGGATISKSAQSKTVRKHLKQLDTFNMGSSPAYNQEIKPSKSAKQDLDPITTHHRIKKDIISASLKLNSPFGKVKTYKVPFDKKKESKSILNRLKLMNPLIDNIKNFGEDALHAHHSSHFHDGTVKYDE
mgnify:FL=1